MAGKWWFQADKQHLHHRMLALGHGHPQAVALLWLWSAVIAVGTVAIGISGAWWAYAGTVAGAVLAGWLTWGGRPRKGRHA